MRHTLLQQHAFRPLFTSRNIVRSDGLNFEVGLLDSNGPGLTWHEPQPDAYAL
jgi:hypothetical protein